MISGSRQTTQPRRHRLHLKGFIAFIDLLETLRDPISNSILPIVAVAADTPPRKPFRHDRSTRKGESIGIGIIRGQSGVVIVREEGGSIVAFLIAAGKE